MQATSKIRETTSEDAWALFISRCRYANNEYSNKFNISFAIVDIKCDNKFEAKGLMHPTHSHPGTQTRA